MNAAPCEARQARRLLPLIRSIGHEIAEREASLGTFLEEGVWSGATSSEAAEMAVHHREVRRAYRELERLGCSVVGHEPLTLRIPALAGERRQSLLWQIADAPVAV